MKPPAEFASPAALRQTYAEGLGRLLAGHDGLGSYILVLANAACDPALWQLLEGRLEERHYHLAALVASALRQGRELTAPQDDLLVFLKLMAMGFGAAGLVETRSSGPWEVSFNPLRALRPPRASRTRTAGICLPFDPNGFHFNLGFLRDEVFWSGELLGRPVRMLYNKFPFAELHGLLVPEPERELPQLLTPELHGWAWALAEALGATLPGFGLAYNSIGAHASVNHLHFQGFLRSHPLPVTHPRWAHNGGSVPYPARCEVFHEPLAAWEAIDALHCAGIAYNLVYQPGRLYLLPRRHQGSYPQAGWVTGHAWYEMAGGVVSFNRDDYDSLDAQAIEAQLRLTSAPA